MGGAVFLFIALDACDALYRPILDRSMRFVCTEDTLMLDSIIRNDRRILENDAFSLGAPNDRFHEGSCLFREMYPNSVRVQMFYIFTR